MGLVSLTDEEARRVLAAAVPEGVHEVCRVLAGAGHQAVSVGGAVRDALLGRPPGDWDVATSARPEEVIGLFRHTIPTGLAHGTVTVVLSRARVGEHAHVEVTTFRGEGAYSDARRPDHVVFGVPLLEDLARRDLVVNAMAYDPAGDVLHDPFGGREDLVARRLRAVGDPVARFTEDGLRVMRAMRFAAQLEFELDPATEAGIGPALPSLAKVSRERVADELRKTLAAREPSRGLVIARRTGIVATILPELAARLDDGWAARVDRATPDARLAAFVAPLADPTADPRRLDRATARRVADLLRALKLSNAELELAAQLVGVARATAEPAWTPVQVRRLLAELDPGKRAAAVALWRAESPPSAALVDLAQAALDAHVPLAVRDLAVTGADLMKALDRGPGPDIGRLLVMLLDRVLDDPARNTREALLAEAQQLELELARP
jgi:tRNA nucleotidyltransferase (CCA-adding enzyme)